MRAANCCTRAKSVLRLMMSGSVWMMPESGSAYIAAARQTPEARRTVRRREGVMA